MPHVATSPADLIETITGAAHLDGDRLVIDDEKAFRDTAIRDLAWTAAFSDDEATTAAAQWLVWEASQELGALSASIHELYLARGRGRGRRASRSRPSTSARRRSTWRGRCSMRPRAPMSARSSSRSRAASRPTPTSARSTSRRPCSPAPSPRAGELPVFIQGDHYQFNAKKYAADPEAMTEEIRRACRLAIDSGYRNIDIDSSTLVDLSKPTRRRAAARELHAGGRADRPDPLARDRRRHDQRRWRDRRGRPSELDGRGAARLHRWVRPRARRHGRRARPASRR